MTQLTDPDCPQSVRDQINGAAQPTTQAIQQARELAANVAEAMEGCLCDDCMDHGTRIIAEALLVSVSASEREALEARVKELEAKYTTFECAKGPQPLYAVKQHIHEMVAEILAVLEPKRS
jgi:BMFP domain-containing protein YqiC